MPPRADVAQLVERQLPKLEVAGSKPVVRSSSALGSGHAASRSRPLLSRNRVFRTGPASPIGVASIPFCSRRSLRATPAASSGSPNAMWCGPTLSNPNPLSPSLVSVASRDSKKCSPKLSAPPAFTKQWRAAPQCVQVHELPNVHAKNVTVETQRGIQVRSHDGHVVETLPGDISCSVLIGRSHGLTATPSRYEKGAGSDPAPEQNVARAANFRSGYRSWTGRCPGSCASTTWPGRSTRRRRAP